MRDTPNAHTGRNLYPLNGATMYHISRDVNGANRTVCHTRDVNTMAEVVRYLFLMNEWKDVSVTNELTDSVHNFTSLKSFETWAESGFPV